MLELPEGCGPGMLTAAAATEGNAVGGWAGGGGGGGGGGADFCVIEFNGYALAMVPRIDSASGI